MLQLRTYYLHLLLLIALLITLAYAAPLVAERVQATLVEPIVKTYKVTL